ncbi:RAD9, HUS1, RAD1-interacting nuclear orphan protein 1 [Eucyclogobius newberryi]|uniref:RAD9, HUS1, RAD1-interacting nuclear orphan protein 1 n=1 Tax=Eucyclogobius newberryi TaxID=166745 RepID=UPI003B5A0A4F
MPRRKIKTGKEPLGFRERPTGGARVQHNVPEVRAALNPKDFFRETQEHDGSTLNSWVTPQFDVSLPAIPTKRRRRCLSSTSVRGNFTQQSRKGSVCSSRFPTLLFETKSRELHCEKERKKASDYCTSSASNNSCHQGFCQNSNTMCKRVKDKKDLYQNNVIKAHSGRVTDLCQVQSVIPSEASCISPEDPSSHSSKHCTNADIAPALPKPTSLKITEENSTCSRAVNLLCSSPACTPSSSRTLDILVPDTPESDYGVKVTWRRRKREMLLLKEKGYLSDLDSMIYI